MNEVEEIETVESGYAALYIHLVSIVHIPAYLASLPLPILLGHRGVPAEKDKSEM